MKGFRLALAGIFAVLGIWNFALGGDFVRIKEEAAKMELQTAILRYEKAGVEVDLIGAVHLADAKYYRFLNQFFEQYDALLFEMVGGEHLGGGQLVEAGAEEALEIEEEVDKPEEEDALRGLGTIYGAMEKALGLVGQGEVIDYMKENFVHADLTMQEFTDLQRERGESLLGFMIRASVAAPKPEREPNSFKMMQGLIGGRPDLVKQELMYTMAEGDTQLNEMSGENVIIDARNAKAIEVMDGEIEKGQESLGIFYGAAHLEDLAERLEKKGFKLVWKKWLTAWEVEG